MNKLLQRKMNIFFYFSPLLQADLVD